MSRKPSTEPKVGEAAVEKQPAQPKRRTTEKWDLSAHEDSGVRDQLLHITPNAEYVYSPRVQEAIIAGAEQGEFDEMPEAGEPIDNAVIHTLRRKVIEDDYPKLLEAEAKRQESGLPIHAYHNAEHVVRTMLRILDLVEAMPIEPETGNDDADYNQQRPSTRKVELMLRAVFGHDDEHPGQSPPVETPGPSPEQIAADKHALQMIESGEYTMREVVEVYGMIIGTSFWDSTVVPRTKEEVLVEMADVAGFGDPHETISADEREYNAEKSNYEWMKQSLNVQHEAIALWIRNVEAVLESDELTAEGRTTLEQLTGEAYAKLPQEEERLLFMQDFFVNKILVPKYEQFKETLVPNPEFSYHKGLQDKVDLVAALQRREYDHPLVKRCADMMQSRLEGFRSMVQPVYERAQAALAE